MANLEISGNWSEYQRLVLSELERHNTLLTGVDARLQEFRIDLRLQKDDIDRMKTELNVLKQQVIDEAKKTETLTKKDNIEEAVNNNRKWIVSILFLFLTALLVPLFNIILQLLGVI